MAGPLQLSAHLERLDRFDGEPRHVHGKPDQRQGRSNIPPPNSSAGSEARRGAIEAPGNVRSRALPGAFPIRESLGGVTGGGVRRM